MANNFFGLFKLTEECSKSILLWRVRWWLWVTRAKWRHLARCCCLYVHGVVAAGPLPLCVCGSAVTGTHTQAKGVILQCHPCGLSPWSAIFVFIAIYSLRTRVTKIHISMAIFMTFSAPQTFVFISFLVSLPNSSIALEEWRTKWNSITLLLTLSYSYFFDRLCCRLYDVADAGIRNKRAL